MRDVLTLILILALVMAVVMAGAALVAKWRATAATSQASALRAEQGLIVERTNSSIRLADADARRNWEDARFNRDMAVLQELDHRLMFGSNAYAAALNSMWTFVLVAILGLVVVCQTGLGFVAYKRLREDIQHARSDA